MEKYLYISKREKIKILMKGVAYLIVALNSVEKERRKLISFGGDINKYCMKLRKSLLPIVLLMVLLLTVTAISAGAASLDPNINLAKTNWGTNNYTGTGPALSYNYSFGRNWNTTPSDGISRASFPAATGTLKVAVIFLDCTNRRAADVTQVSPINYRLVENNYALIEPVPDFFWQASYGQLKVELINVNAEVNDNEWFSSTTLTDAQMWSSPANQFNNAIALAVAAGFDFSEINYPVVFTPRNATGISGSQTNHTNLTMPLPASSGLTSKSSVQNFNIGSNGLFSWRRPWTTMAHEMGHTLGMIDLYTYDYPVNETTGSGSQRFQFIGGWDIQGSLNAHSPDHLAWHKWKVRWIKDEQVRVVPQNSSQTVTLTANAYWDKDSDDRAADGIKMIYIPTETLRSGTTTKTETGYVIESRRPIGNDAPGPVAPGGSQAFAGAQDQGVLIYRVDSLGPNTTNGGHGRGGIKIIDGRPDGVNNKTQTSTNSLDLVCFGFRSNQVQTFRDEARNITIQVLSQDELTDTVLVTYGDPSIDGSDEFILAGQTAKVDFTVSGIAQLTSGSFDVSYDPGLVKPISVDYSNLPADVVVAANTNFAPGIVRFGFAAERNVAMDDVLFSVTFAEATPGAVKVFETSVPVAYLTGAVEYKNDIEMGPSYQPRTSSGSTITSFTMNTYIRVNEIRPVKLTDGAGSIVLGIMGDVTGDGLITPEDAIMILQMHVGLIPWTERAIFFGNLKGYGDYPDPIDAALILRMVVGG